MYLDNGKDKVMFLTKDDLSSPSAIKQKEDEGFDPWEQHGLFGFNLCNSINNIILKV
jgi:hypothetical protein